MSELKCPGCGETSGSKICGVEVQGVYDGTLYWTCFSCGWSWARDWTGYGRRQEVADSMVAAANAARAEAAGKSHAALTQAAEELGIDLG